MKYLAGILSSLTRIGLLAIAAASSTLAQSTTGVIEGRVFNSTNGQSLQSAIVRVIGTELRAETGRDGTFIFRNVPAGDHALQTSYFGLSPVQSSVNVNAGQTAFLVIDMTAADAVQLETVKVEAAVLGQARAINQQRTADAMVNITSEELFGEMTDNNIARALQRIPGISANSDGGTEIPRYVNIRGFDGSLNSVQLNGTRLPTSGSGQGTVYGDTARAFALDDLPANSITNIEIVKAPTPDMDGDTVGGIVNLVQKSAFDRSGRTIEVKAGMDYIALREKFVPNFELGYGDLLMDGRLGVRFDFSYYKGDEGFDNIDYDWNPLIPRIPYNSYLNLGDTVFFHEDTEYNNYFIERDRYGFAGSIDYKVSDRTRIHFRPTFNSEKRSEDDRRFHKIMDNDHGRAASAPPADAPVGSTYVGTRGNAVVVAPGRGIYTTIDSVSTAAGRSTLLPNGRGRGAAGYRQALNEIDIEFYSLDFGGEHELGWGELRWSLVNSQSTKDEERYLVRFDRQGLQWAYDRPNIYRPDYRVVNGIDPLAIPTRGAVDFFINPSSSNMNSNPRETEETIWQARADLEVPFLEGTGVNGTFKTGVKTRWMERDHNRDFRYFRLADFATYDFATHLRPGGETVSDFSMPYYPDTGRIVRDALSGNAAYVRDTSNARRTPSLASDYEASEDSIEGYAMSTFDVGPKLRLIAGARVEHTTFEASTPVYSTTNPPLADRAPEMETRKNDYTKVLPGIHARYEARNNLVFRSAYTHTYGRPAFRESIAVTTFDEASGTITTGNPDLNPYTSENWDFSVEYFGRRAAYFQVALFHKRVSNFVLESEETITGQSDFRGFPLNPSETYSLISFSNQHESVNRGIELAGRYKFVYFPAPFDGFYLDGSVTYTDSDGRYADRPDEKLPTYGASEWLYYLALGYQTDRFSILLSYRYRSEYLEGLENIDRQNRDFGLPPNVGDDWWGEEKFWNLETSYRFTQNIRMYCNFSNLGEYMNSSYQAPPSQRYPEDSYWHKMRISFGVKATF